ncbi:MAG: type VI secretion system Vgr family protein [Labilibaculum antarcticum]
MALQTNTIIKVNGVQYPNFLDLQIIQGINSHHYFDISILWEQFTEEGNAIIDKTQSFIGQKLEILITDNVEGSTIPEGTFIGIITEAETVKSEFSSVGDHIRIKGYSPTILLDDGPHCIGYEEKDLAEIVRLVTAAYQIETPPTINPITRDVFPYIVQYNQSAFGFLSQLASRFGEWFYYDGQKIIFGSESTEPLPLKYGIDLMDFNLKMLTHPKTFNYVTRDYYTDEKLESSIAAGTELTGYHAFMAEKSEAMFGQETIVDFHRHTADGDLNQALENSVVKQGEANVSRMVILTGSTMNPGLKVGGLISIAQRTANGETAYGTYLVTKLSHTCQMSGDYKNHFEAIPENVVYPPYTNVALFPQCQTQTAMVVANADPQSMGRIRVQFSWQLTAPSPWIRMTQPHGGADKGFHFIPEIGEEVMVGFEAGNAEKPFVIGTLYHGAAKPESFASDTNDVKVIRTRSGHTIELNDLEGEEKINIYDNEGSIITFDTQAKSLTISSVETIDISAKNINISAEENIQIAAQQNIGIAAQADASMQAEGNLALQSTGDTTVNSSAALTLAATTDAALSGQNASVSGQAEAGLSGMQVKVEGQMTAVQGASGKIEIM